MKNPSQEPLWYAFVLIPLVPLAFLCLMVQGVISGIALRLEDRAKGR